MVVQSAISIWVFSSQTIFPERILVYQSLNRVKFYYMQELEVLERIFHPEVGIFLICIIITVGVFTILEPLVVEVAKICCFKRPRRGQTIGSNTMRMYSVEVIQMSNQLDLFSYEMILSKQFRRALILLNGDDLDEAEDETAVLAARNSSY